MRFSFFTRATAVTATASALLAILAIFAPATITTESATASGHIIQAGGDGTSTTNLDFGIPQVGYNFAANLAGGPTNEVLVNNQGVQISNDSGVFQVNFSEVQTYCLTNWQGYPAVSTWDSINRPTVMVISPELVGQILPNKFYAVTYISSSSNAPIILGARLLGDPVIMSYCS